MHKNNDVVQPTYYAAIQFAQSELDRIIICQESVPLSIFPQMFLILDHSALEI